MNPVRLFAAGTWLGLFAALTLCLCVAVTNAQALSYVPPAVTTAPTTLFSGSSDSNGNPGRVAVDKAGNVYFIVNGSSSTLMEIPASSPPVTNSSPLTLVTGLGEYNTHAVTVDANGNLWVTTGNAGGITTSNGSTDYLSMAEIPAVNGVPNTAAIPSGGESLTAMDATHCATGNTTPCTIPNYWMNTPSGASTGVSGPQVEDFYVDAAGNVYYLDVYDGISVNGNNQFLIAEVNPIASPQTATVLFLSTDKSQNDSGQIVVGGDGNVYYVDSIGGYKPGGSSATGNVYLVSSGALTQVGNTATLATAQITGATGISSDFYGNLYIVGTASGASTSASSSPTQISEVPNEAGTLNFTDEFGIASGLTDQISWGGSLDSWGNYYYANSTNVDQVQVGGYNFGSVPVGSIVNASSTIPAPTLTVYFNANETVAGNYFPTGSPTTNTVAGLLQSFPYSGTKSIGGGGSQWTPGQTGTIIMDFEPVHPGLSKGAYTTRDGSGNLEFTANLQGVGLGPQPMFLPGVGSQLFTAAATSPTDSTPLTLSGPKGIAVDSFGDIFVADTGNGKVVADCLSSTSTATGNSFCANSGYTGAVVELGTSFTSPAGIALDGANSLYVVDSAANSVTYIQSDNLNASTPITSSTTFGGMALNGPTAIALDGYANIYIADTGNNRVVMAHQYGAAGTNDVVVVPSTMKFGSTALNGPSGLAVDAAGDLFIADTGNNRVVEYSALGVGTVISTTGVTLSAPTGVVFLPSGNLIVADTTNQLSFLSPSAGTGMALNGNAGTVISNSSINVGKLVGVAADPWGNLYGVDTLGNQVLELNVTSPASAPAFPITTALTTSSTDDTTFVYNSGTAPLTISAAPAIDAGDLNFGVLGTGTCTNGASVTAGAYCTVNTEFTPQAVSGVVNGTVTLTDNQLSYTLVTSTANETALFGTNGNQTIALSGTSTASSIATQTITGFNPLTTLVAGQQITLSATGGASGNPVVFTIDPSSPCPACATTNGTNGTTLTAVSAGSVIVDANQAAGTGSNGTSYSAAPTVQVNITIINATAAGVPAALLVNQATFIGDFGANYSGGFTSSNNPAGGSIAVNSLGDVIDGNTYGNNIQIWAPSSSGYTQTTVNNGGAGGASVDAANNIYAGYIYYQQIWKVPFIGSAYATTIPSTGAPNCAGGAADTSPCLFNLSGLVNSEAGVTATAFDTLGNLFIVSEPNSKTGLNGIYMIPAASLATISYGNVTLTPVYTSDQYTISSITLDANNNLFFTDSNFTNIADDESASVSCGSPNPAAVTSISNALTYSVSNGSTLYELANTGSGAYATTPVVLQSFTNSTPGCYDDVMSGVAADRTSGVVYFSTVQDGIWAFENNGTPFTSTSLPTFYAVAGSSGTSSDPTNMTGGKGLAVGAPGVVYAVGGDSTSDDLYMLTLGSVTEPTAQYQGTSVSASTSVVDNAFPCSKAATLAFNFTGTTAADFSGSQGTSCASIASGAFETAINPAADYPATITFAPNDPNAQTATLAISDTANGGTGSATISALAQTTAQTFTVTPLATTTYTYSPNLAITLTASNGASNNPVNFTIEASPASTGVGTISPATSAVSNNTSTTTLTVTQAGSFVIDATEAGGVVGGVYYQDASQTAVLTLTVNPATQTITFTPITGSPFTYSNSPQVTIPLSATGGASGNPVNFSVEKNPNGGYGTVSASTQSGTNAWQATLTVTQAGPIVIDAEQAGNTNYSQATLTNAQTIQVNQAAQTITFNQPSQPIHFITTSTGIPGGIAVQVSAVGGGSDLPIQFSVDPSSTMMGSFSPSTVTSGTSISTSTLTIPLQSVTSGNIVIDATEPGNTNYTAVTVSPLGTLTILPPLPLQTITWANPGTQVSGGTLTLTGTASSTLPVVYTSTTTSVCTVNNNVATFVTAGTCTITATQPGDNVNFAAAPPVTQSFTVNAAGQNPAIALNLTLTSLNLQPGTVGTSNITVTSQNNFTGAVVLSCSGAPSGYTCSFTPAANSTNPVIVQANQAAAVTLAISPSGSASLEHSQRPFAPLATLAAALVLIGFRKRSRIFLVLLIMLSVIGLGLFTGCGGSSSTTTQSTTSSVTVTATAIGMSGASGSVTQTATVSVTVE
jgi:sugar lactone lactonase YvrE